MFEWDPFEEFDKIEKKMRESFKKMFKIGLKLKMGQEEEVDVEEQFSTVQGMDMEVRDENENLVIKAKLPGFEKQDVGVKLTENSVEIAAHKKEQKQEKSEKMFRFEGKMNSVRRAMALPVLIDSNNAKVEFENGVLTIRAPKKISQKMKKEVRA